MFLCFLNVYRAKSLRATTIVRGAQSVAKSGDAARTSACATICGEGALDGLCIEISHKFSERSQFIVKCFVFSSTHGAWSVGAGFAII